MMVFGYAHPLLGWNIEDFHIWQLLTAHFVHYDLRHLITNMLALGILLYLFPASFKTNIKGVIVAIVLIDLYLWFSGVRYYVGYSGLLYVIPGMSLANFILQKKYLHALLILFLYFAYTLILQQSVNISDRILWVPLSQAHFVGFVAGIVVAVNRIALFKKKNTNI